MDPTARTALEVALRRLLDDFGAEILDDPTRVRAVVTDLLGEHATRGLVDAVVEVTSVGVVAVDVDAAEARLLAHGVDADVASSVASAWTNASIARLELHGASTAEPPPVPVTLPPPPPTDDADLWGESSTSEPIAGPETTTPEDGPEDGPEDSSAPPRPSPMPPPTRPSTTTGDRRRPLIIAAAAVIAVLALVGGALALGGAGDDDDTDVATDDRTTTSRAPADDEEDDAGDESTTTTSTSTTSTTSESTTVTTATTAPPTGGGGTTSRPPTTRRPTTTVTTAPTTTTTTAPPPPPPPPPSARGDSYSIFPEHDGSSWSSHSFSVTGNDGGTWDSVQVASYPDGSLSLSGTTFYYSPYKNGPYSDTFSYRLVDSSTGRSSTASVSVYVDCNGSYPCGS